MKGTALSEKNRCGENDARNSLFLGFYHFCPDQPAELVPRMGRQRRKRIVDPFLDDNAHERAGVVGP